MGAALHLLPTELVELICKLGALDKCDIGSLRLICRQLASQTTPVFFHTFVSTITTNLRPESLLRLEEISQHSQARQAVRKLVIDDLLSLGIPRESIELGQNITGPWNRSSDGILVPPFPAEIDRLLHHTLVNGLPNCRNFAFNGNSSKAADVENNWISLSDIFAFFLRCISEIRLPVKSFTVNEDMDVTRLSPDVYHSSGFEDAWANHLQELHLNFQNHDLLTTKLRDFVTTLVITTRNLKQLTLNIITDFNEELIDDLCTFSPAWRPPLCNLSIQYFTFEDKENLFAFLSLFRETLRSLTGLVLGLQRGSWRHVLPALPQHLPHLNELEIGFLTERYKDSSCRHLVFFCPIRNETLPKGLKLIRRGYSRRENAKISGIAYEGQNVDTVINLLSRTGYVYARHGALGGIPWSSMESS